MTKHSPEPWLVSAPQTGTIGGWEVGAFNGQTLCGVRLTDLVCMMSHHPGTQQTAGANARRIAACVNILAGIPTEDLERAAAEEGSSKERLAKLLRA